jgi:hypothetical protein
MMNLLKLLFAYVPFLKLAETRSAGSVAVQTLKAARKLFLTAAGPS